MTTDAFLRGVRDFVAMAAVVSRYYVSISWRVSRVLDNWRARAELISDPCLRGIAVSKLRDEHLHAQAAAVFATTAPRANRAALVELLVTFEVMYDFLDAVSEAHVADQVANGRCLHRALLVALDGSAERGGYYAEFPGRDDGGYLDELAAACRHVFEQLPSADVVRPYALAASERCCGGQTHTHAVTSAGIDQLRAWALSLASTRYGAYSWWELAAASAASLAIHALFAVAADPTATRGDAAQVDAAYFPSVCALAALLDSLIDRDADRDAGAHSFVGYYSSRQAVTQRLAMIAADGVEAMAGLRGARRHAVIATGVAGFYLSDVDARRPFAVSATSRVIDALNPFVLRPILAIAAAKRRPRVSQRGGVGRLTFRRRC
jgi:tetraprenyl-beta-curcumene synthase